MTAEPEPSGASLPAPYTSPWQRLRRDLRDALADLRLRAQELVRLNREGSLPRPPFWPRAVAGLFWPLLLVLALLLTTVLILAVTRPRPAGPSPAPPVSVVVPSPVVVPEPPAPPSPESAPEVAAPAPSDTEAETGSEPEPDVTNPVAAEPDPAWRVALQAVDPDGLIVAARSDDARALLELTLSEAYGHLSAPERLRLARLWQEQALTFAYQRLELRDRQGRLLGRPALVGGGMVLLEPGAPASPGRQDGSPSPSP